MGSENSKSPSWWFFDLDDTLHEFRKASSSTVDITLQLIIQQQSTQQPTPQEDSVTFADLKAAYSKVLEETTSSAFTDGKTSHEYRAERSKRTLNALNLSPTPEQTTEILAMYEKTLMQHLILKPGAIPLLKSLKQQGKHVAIVTEGPQDAQQRTVAALRLEPHFDHLITTNAFGMAKVDGLFERAIEVLGVEGREVVMMGDSWDRDAVPAGKVGIRCVWHAEGSGEKERIVEFGGEGEERVVVVDSLEKLRGMVEGV
ncbi:hypothetical protein COCSADRAFT_354189 [Bipolaris sorokiniana ND90Pr]|uniref:Haloacid dehalogenase-like hydrolase n=1 Tax=Cochliobolus sativus (strain ND90Pr / ATCC 201652) TaxID=665912 RepID=M2SHW0_COCSN|nr:uncharacterized protein COCSADRAFT_354189 [Bipolaris sorokiniana ND90Pr]EMD66803.1 hypothetical protein COCSADRAFT_354189 [Bipolaris sorokiniana ND90Pr]